MTPAELTAYLHQAIPLSAAMEVEAIDTSAQTTTIRAAHGPNINHQGAVFGGSLSALALLAGFAAVLNRLRAEGYDHHVVVQRNAYSYDLPANSDVTARAEIDEQRWSRFVSTLARRNIGRVTVDVIVEDDAQTRVGACQVFCVRLWFMLSGRGVRGR